MSACAGPEAQAAFDELRVSNDPAHIDAWLAVHAPRPHRLRGESPQSLPETGIPMAATDFMVAC